MNFLTTIKLRTALWIIVIAAISTAMAMTIHLRAPALGLAARDALVRARGPVAPPEEVVLIAIDEASIQRYGRFPWPRSLMAKALDQVAAARPRAIALNVLYTDPTTETEDVALAEAIKRAGNVVVAAQLVETPSQGAQWLRPLTAIESAAAGIGHGNVLTDFDGVARSLTLREADDEGTAYWAMTLEIVRVGEQLRREEVRDVPEAIRIGSRTIPIESDSPTMTFAPRQQQGEVQTFRSSQMTIDYVGPAGSFGNQTVSIADLLDGKVPADRFNGKYVLIGVTAAAMSDRVASPFARQVSQNGSQEGSTSGPMMTGIEVSANALTTILRGRYYGTVSEFSAVLVAVLVAILVIAALFLVQGAFELARQLIAMLVIAGLIVGLSYLAFARMMIFPPLVPGLLSLTIAAPLALLLRSLVLSASLDERIAEMVAESARLSPLTIGTEHAGERFAFLPRGAAEKARALAGLQNRLMARTHFVDRALQSVEDGLVIADLNGRIAFANPRSASILQRPQRSLLGSNLFDRLNDAEFGPERLNDDQLSRVKKEAMNRLLRDRIAIEREIVVDAAEPRYYILRMAAVSDQGEAEPLGIVATLSDISKQRELQKMQNDVVQLVTHEMKTPLTAIRGMSEVLMKFDASSEKRREMSATIHEASQRLTRMIDDYLDLTRLESGAREPRMAFHRIGALIETNLLLLDPIAAERGIRLNRNFTSDLPVILADADLLARAITNLVANAIKYSPPDTVVEVAARASDENLFISVADQGYGIPEEYRTQIFEKFFRVPRVEDADTPGTGLGLALVREIAELHGGRIALESEAGRGSTFTLRLPLKREAQKAIDTGMKQSPQS